MAQVTDRRITDMPGTVELIDVPQSPRMFRLPILADGQGQLERGVLIQLAVNG